MVAVAVDTVFTVKGFLIGLTWFGYEVSRAGSPRATARLPVLKTSSELMT
jgi:hypothetical protein